MDFDSLLLVGVVKCVIVQHEGDRAARITMWTVGFRLT